MEYTKSLNLPEALQTLSLDGLENVSDEIRQFLIDKFAEVGGHVGPNLGIIEPTIALHKVFDFKNDRLVWDVSHQDLPHKLLTNRIELMEKFHEKGGASAFSNPAESEYDNFIVGHTSTSVTQAVGIARARDIKGEKFNVVAVLGDGSLSGGQAFEGLNNAGMLKSNFILLLNDNEMSIDFNAGGLYSGLARLRATRGTDPNNIFTFMGFEYKYLEEGNDLAKLIDALEELKDINHPVVLHIHTLKGKGLDFAVKHPESWHYGIPFDKTSGAPTVKHDENRALIVNSIDKTIEYIINKPDSYAIIPGSPLLGRKLQDTVPERYIDTAIAEQAAVSIASSMAKFGVDSYMIIASSFLQRAYDQVLQDWTLNDCPATLIVLGCGVTPTDAAHNGVFDIPMLSNVPNLVYMSPTNDDEYVKMLKYCASANFPTAIRLPAGTIPELEISDREVDEIVGYFGQENGADKLCISTASGGVLPKSEFIAKSEVLHRGSKVALLGLGIMLDTAVKTARLLKDIGINATVVNPRFVSHLDTQLLDELKDDHQLVVTLEDGIAEGGFGAKVATYYSMSDVKVLVRGVKKEHIDSLKFAQILERYRWASEMILDDIKEALAEV
ncbi:MAG: 1-deoxy-D-xylulose-5-phosphate synthase [Candidatus Ancillula sp.]|jgi:1-deoxy-D-xylulose-5-phosphate synthase|nr:1-deoxy-D-xylulose-5-phosphate synthase [Candidatus Ancillula sp.]